MADSDWHYLENQFDNATKKSKKRMKLIKLRHSNSLPSAPDAIKAALIARLAAPAAAFNAKYNDWRNLAARRAGTVQWFEGLLQKLSASDTEDIETTFKGVHKRGTQQHTTVFAGGRAPYQTGPDDERVAALERLRERIEDLNEPALAPVVALIADVLTPLQQSNALIGELDSAAELARTQIEPLRVALSVALYKNLAQLMMELGPSEEIAAFFDLELLRETQADEEEIEPVPSMPPPE